MSPAANPGQKTLWQFDEFLVDPVRRVLLRDGEPVTITPKALSILFALLEKPGEVVTKQELIQKIWPDTFVTEANLTQNISSLRKALGERANDRGYIVTVPGRGYSFTVQPVEVEMPPEEGAAPAAAPGALETAGPASAQGEPFAPSPEQRKVTLDAAAPSSASMPVLAPPETPVAPRRGRRGLLAPAALALAVLAAIAVIWLGGRRPPPAAVPAPVPDAAPATAAVPVAQRAAVAVLGFRNLSGDKGADWLAPALAEMLTTEMAAGSKVRVISGDNVLRARRSLSLPYTDHLEKMEMERLHSFLGADLVVVGAYLALGKEDGRRIRLDVRVLKIPDGDAVRSLSELGTQAEKWAQKILHPKSLLDKLGVKAGQRVLVLGVEEEGFLADLRERTDGVEVREASYSARSFDTSRRAGRGVVAGTANRGYDAVFVCVEGPGDFRRLAGLKRAIRPEGAVWAVFRKGRKDFNENDILRGGLAAGLVDVKVVRFSDTHTASKFVIRNAERSPLH